MGRRRTDLRPIQNQVNPMTTRNLLHKTAVFCCSTLIILAVMSSSLRAQSHTQDGATAGGVAGAIIGGIIGHQNDETPEGALIGGAVGAIAGGLLGKAHDNDLQRHRYQQQQAYYQQQQQYYRQQQVVTQSGVSPNDVVNMARSGLSEPLIINQLQTKGVQRRLEVSEIIALHQQGVNDNIITAMQQAPLATQLASPPQPVAQQPLVVQPTYRQPTVIVQEPVIYSHSPVIVERYYRPYPSYHRHHHAHRSGASIRFGF